MTREDILDRKLDALRREVLAAGYDSLIYNDFQSAMPMLRKTELYSIFKEMPKAWLCHAHFEASFDPDFSLDLAFASDDVYISPAPGEFGWKIAYRQAFEGCTAPAGWTRLKDAAAARPELRAQIKRSIITTLEDISPRIWPRFEEIFITLRNINCYRPHLIKVFTKAFEDMAAEGIQGVDYRFICQDIFDEDGHHYSPEETMSVYFEIEKEVRRKYPWFTIRFVYSSYKGFDREAIAREIAFAKRLSDAFPGRIAGFDMVGCEDCGRDLNYYGPLLTGAPVPIIMHAGESVDPANHNLEQALELGLPRIGHGLNLYRYPAALEEFRKRGVMLEVCPLSNQLLGYTPDLRLHPAKDYIRKGLNVTINSDDCGVFGASYLTDDLLAAYLCWNLSLPEMKRCLINSLSVAGAGKAEQFGLMWDEFLSVTLRFGSRLVSPQNCCYRP